MGLNPSFLSFPAVIFEVMRPDLKSPLYLFSLERSAEWLCQTNQFVMLRARSMQQPPLGLTANDSRVIFNNSPSTSSPESLGSGAQIGAGNDSIAFYCPASRKDRRDFVASSSRRLEDDLTSCRELGMRRSGALKPTPELCHGQNSQRIPCWW